MLAFLWVDVFIVCMYVCYVSNKISVFSIHSSVFTYLPFTEYQLKPVTVVTANAVAGARKCRIYMSSDMAQNISSLSKSGTLKASQKPLKG